MSSGRPHSSCGAFHHDQAQKKKHVETTDLYNGDQNPPPNYTESNHTPDSLAASFYENPRPRKQAPDYLTENIFSPANTSQSGSATASTEHTATDEQPSEERKKTMPGQFPGEELTSEKQGVVVGSKAQAEVADDDQDNEGDIAAEEVLRYKTAKKAWTDATDRRFTEYEDELEVKPESGV